MARKPTEISQETKQAKPKSPVRKTAAKPSATKRVTSKTSTSAATRDPAGLIRVVIEGVKPEVDCGRFAIKRSVNEQVMVEADVFTDGHDKVAADLLFRFEGEKNWQRLPMKELVNDAWRGRFTVERLGRYQYTLEAWVDHFETWRGDLVKRAEAEQELDVPFAIGIALIRESISHASRADAAKLKQFAADLEKVTGEHDKAFAVARDEELAALMRRNPDPDIIQRYGRELDVVVDPERARFSSWYELFPRSSSDEPGRHGTFKDVMARLPYVAGMGFDVLYLPPIHPIGQAFRKGRNNSTEPEPGDVGSPWAIGSEEGGHKAVHPELGTLEDFRELVTKAREHGLEMALDIAFQASPDHPYVKEHPEWFLKRPDGTIQYAENPPKKYQDIYPFHFEGPAWFDLWVELKSVFEFWIDQGVTIFRVDNPHTKPFPFWEWCISQLKREHPELIFLAEAFTRPKVMHRLAKLGYTQSYTYFTWRNTKQELTEYFTELAQEEGREYFRPNVWPNTPDILHEYLQFGGRPAFVARFVLASTMAASYGIYGPAFELHEHRPAKPGSEEYLDSEKYQIRDWNLDDPSSLRALITRVNRIRREHPALQRNATLAFHTIDNDQLIAYSKRAGRDVLLMVVNLDSNNVQSGWLTLPLEQFGLEQATSYQVEDLLTGASYLWHGPTNFVKLDPHGQAAHVFRLRGQAHREQDFDQYM